MIGFLFFFLTFFSFLILVLVTWGDVLIQQLYFYYAYIHIK